MKSVYGFVVTPKGGRYNNKKKIGDKELILNTEIFNHQYVNREAIVKSVPIAFKTDIQVGDTIIVHHNVFRRWHDQHAIERNSASYISEGVYVIFADQIFAYKRSDTWKSLKGFCFIQPLKENNPLYNEKEKLIGVVKYSDGTVQEGDLVGFKSLGQYEFVINGMRMYRVKSNLITVKYFTTPINFSFSL